MVLHSVGLLDVLYSTPAVPSPCVSCQAGAEQASRLDLNHATLSQLDGLPGIGPVIAGRMIQFREDNGPFKRIEDLMNVRGIGEKTFLKLAERITVEEPE